MSGLVALTQGFSLPGGFCLVTTLSWSLVHWGARACAGLMLHLEGEWTMERRRLWLQAPGGWDVSPLLMRVQAEYVLHLFCVICCCLPHVTTLRYRQRSSQHQLAADAPSAVLHATLPYPTYPPQVHDDTYVFRV